ncbi:MAG: hypothetical protein ACOZBW_02775 [Thermodesulfobacteriota bacterium]
MAPAFSKCPKQFLKGDLEFSMGVNDSFRPSRRGRAQAVFSENKRAGCLSPPQAGEFLTAPEKPLA